MANNPSDVPPSYGAVVQNQPPYPTAGTGDPEQVPPYPPADPTMQQPPAEAVNHPSPYPQPGQVPPSGYPQEPPPQYEPPKTGPPGAAYPQAYQPGVYPPQGYQGTTAATTVYPVQQTVVVAQQGWGPLPRTMECPNCHATVSTAISYQAGGLTWLAGGLLCLFGCWMGCCLIPFCIPDLQDVEHRCPNCGVHVGTFTRL